MVAMEPNQIDSLAQLTLSWLRLIKSIKDAHYTGLILSQSGELH